MQTFEQFWEDVSNYRLEVKYNFIKIQETFKEANGCGSKGGLSFPSTFWGLSILSACTNHDIDWALAESYNELIASNHRFRRNMEKIIDKDSSNRFMIYIRLKRMNKYYSAVKLLGTKNYADERNFFYPGSSVRNPVDGFIDSDF